MSERHLTIKFLGRWIEVDRQKKKRPNEMPPSTCSLPTSPADAVPPTEEASLPAHKMIKTTDAVTLLGTPVREAL